MFLMANNIDSETTIILSVFFSIGHMSTFVGDKVKIDNILLCRISSVNTPTSTRVSLPHCARTLIL